MASHVSDESKVMGWTYEREMWNTIKSTRNMQQADVKTFKMVLKAYTACGLYEIHTSCSGLDERLH
jgi:hypothetical protein